MITIISAPPRTGKSLYAMEILEKAVRDNPDKWVYTNLIGCKLPGVLNAVSTPTQPFDWRMNRNGILFVLDECHEHPAFSKNDLLKDKDLISREPYNEYINKVNNYENLTSEQRHLLLKTMKVIDQYPSLPDSLKVKEKEGLVRIIKDAYIENNQKRKDEIMTIGKDLTMHGHFGHDFYLITQKPTLLNEYVRAATSEHLILRRFFKLPFAIIYSYAELQESFGLMTRKNAITTRFWMYPKRLYKYYVSAESHPKGSFPKLWIFVAILPFLILFLAFRSTMNWLSPEDKTQQISENTQSTNQLVSQKEDDLNNPTDLTEKCRFAVNLDSKECKEYISELSDKGLSVKPLNVYDPTKPYDVVYKPESFEPVDFPRLKGVLVKNGKCTAFSQQGTIMHDISRKDCFRLASGDRPFDYFKEVSNENTPSTIAPDKLVVEDTPPLQKPEIKDAVIFDQGSNLATI